MLRLFFLIALFPIHAFCQSDTLQVNASGKYELAGFVKVDGASAGKLYDIAKAFSSDEIMSSKAFQVNDDRTKTLIRNGQYYTKNSSGYTNYFSRMECKVTIQCREDGYKYTINNYKASFDQNGFAIPFEDKAWTFTPVFYKIKAVAANHSFDLLKLLRKQMDPTWQQ